MYTFILLATLGIYLLLNRSMPVTSYITSILFATLASRSLYLRKKMLKEVSYDSNKLFINYGGQEEIIPLEFITKVEIKPLGGGYEIHFNTNYVKRKRLTFIPSILYPVNYKVMDKKIGNFRDAIWQAKIKQEDNTLVATNILSSSKSLSY